MTDNPIIIFGKNGQVGRALAAQLGSKAVIYGREQADFSKPDAIKTLLEALNTTPKAIINAVAYTAVDKAEEEEALAFTINAETPAVIAAYCKQHSIPFIHYSTDYVFDGQGNEARKEDALTSPLNAYGRTKLAGEQKIADIGGDYIILRTSWVYDTEGKNFLNTMLRLGQEKESLSIVGDQIGAPSYAPHIAEATINILQTLLQKPSSSVSGIYHLCGAGKTSWYEFANTIFALAQAEKLRLRIKEVNAIPSISYPTPAQRPLNSSLDCSKLSDIFNVRMPHWKAGLQEAIHEKLCLEHAA